MYITKDDLKTHIYADILEEIIRSDEDVANKNIAAAIETTKMYLSRYDLAHLFGTTDALPDAEFEQLKNLVKDIAAWYLVKLNNPNIDLALFRTAYEDAIAVLKDIQKGVAEPAGWPEKADDPTTPINEGSGSVQWGSNRKRTQHF